ncbi:MAG: SUMF1/EgtB/PvdO family nonheme iron enzyme [Bacteroidetes bacterium]|nr:SUMF1/EgtB/PvdO family nonheme iron enzyme [Bacteroidota bacterium]
MFILHRTVTCLFLALPALLYAQETTLPSWVRHVQANPRELPQYVLADPLSALEKEMKLIPAGTFTMGKAEESVPDRQVTVVGFYLQQTEMSVLLYRSYLWRLLQDSSDAAFWAAYPDTACWSKDFPVGYLNPLVENYLQHKAFNEYPVVGVSHAQALACCKWFAAQMEQKQKAVYGELWYKHIRMGGFHLPTEAEWEYAALGGQERSFYPWPAKGKESVHCTYADKGKVLFEANFRPANGNFILDNFEFTAPVKTFRPNGYGLHQMAGNVAEWCEDMFLLQGDRPEVYDRPCNRDYDLYLSATARASTTAQVVRGGGWADIAEHMTVSWRQRELPDAQHSYIGFRIAAIRFR